MIFIPCFCAPDEVNSALSIFYCTTSFPFYFSLAWSSLFFRSHGHFDTIKLLIPAAWTVLRISPFQLLGYLYIGFLEDLSTLPSLFWGFYLSPTNPANLVHLGVGGGVNPSSPHKLCDSNDIHLWTISLPCHVAKIENARSDLAAPWSGNGKTVVRLADL